MFIALTRSVFFRHSGSMEKYSGSDPNGQTAFPVAKAGYPLIFSAAFVTLILALLGMTYLTLVGLVITFFLCGFFRDPDRVIPNKSGAIVSPADGKVILVENINDSAFYEGSSPRSASLCPCLMCMLIVSLLPAL